MKQQLLLNNKYHFKRYTQEEIDWLKKHKDISPREKLAEMFNKRFNSDRTKNGIIWIMQQHNLVRKPTKKTINYNSRPILSERIDKKDGYIKIKISEPNVWKLKQIYVYEKYYNVKVDTKNQIVHFLDKNKYNFDIDNLVLMDRKYIGTFNNFYKQPIYDRKIFDAVIKNIDFMFEIKKIKKDKKRSANGKV